MTEYTIDNVADCQAALVDYIDMQGMSGYASMEATQTISGAWASTKSAFHDFLISFSDDSADVDEKMDNLFKSIETLATNLAPKVETALDTTFTVVIPKMWDYGEQIITYLWSGLDENAYKIGDKAGDLVGEVADKVAEDGPEYLAQGVVMVGKVLAGFSEHTEDIADNIPVFIDNLGVAINEHGGEFAELGWRIVKGIGKGIAATGGYLMGEIMNLIGIPDMGSWKQGLFDKSGYNWMNSSDLVVQAQKNAPKPGSPASGWKPNYKKKVIPGAMVNGSHADGLDYVPFDGYIAELHEGEKVLTADEAKRSGVTVIQNIYAQAQTAADLMDEAIYQQEQAVILGV